jgi:CubicO group peptidase (beta-lactamase class C family)
MLLVLLFVLRLSAQESLDLGALENAFLEEMKPQGVPGAAMVIAGNDRVLLAKGYGLVSAGQSTPVTSQTLFRLGSTSKVFTALAALRLAEYWCLKRQ